MNENPSNTTLSRYQALAFSSPSLALALLLSPITLLPSIFAKYYGLSLVSLGGVLLIIRVFDSVTDVLIGHFSDRYRLRYGTRKPFVLAGGLLVLPCAYFLVNPPGGEVTVLSYVLWSMAFYFCYTLFGIPKFAWAGELTSVPEERIFLFSALAFVAKCAGLLFFIIPFLPIFETQEITPQVLQFGVIVGICVMLPTLYLLVTVVPDGLPPIKKEAKVKSHTASFKEYVLILKLNKPFQIFLGAYFFIGLGLGMFGGLLFLYIDVFLGLGDQYAKMAIIGLLAGLALTPVGYKMAVYLGKRNSWALSMMVLLGEMFYCTLLNPGQAGLTDLIMMQMIFVFASLSLGIVAPAMLNDVIDYGLLSVENGSRGVFMALYTFMVKVEAAIGVSLGLALAGWFGFDATASQQSSEGAFAIRLAMCWLPMAITCLGLYFIYKTPLSEARMEIIGRRLEQRARRDHPPNEKAFA
jgi:GPH family glycoside/pentoside/hexuronide:cation symporter